MKKFFGSIFDIKRKAAKIKMQEVVTLCSSIYNLLYCHVKRKGNGVTAVIIDNLHTAKTIYTQSKCVNVIFLRNGMCVHSL